MAKKIRGKKTAAIVAAALCAVAACVALLVWQPWAATSAGEQATQEEASGQAEDAGEEDTASGTADGEEWPGQSLGYVGPNGEGAIDGDDYETNEEYTEALAAVNGGKENDVEKVVVEGDGADYCEGFLVVRFYRSCSEYDAHRIVEGLGGVWCSDGYVYADTGRDTVIVEAYFASRPSRADLEGLASELETLPEVKSAGLLETGFSMSESSGGEASVASIQQPYLDVSRFYSAWEAVTCDHGATIAVLDSGFDLDHEDLAGNLLPAWDASVPGLLTEDLADGEGHGTMVAGVASAVSGTAVGIEGASHDAWVLPVRVMHDDRGTGVMSLCEQINYMRKCR